MIDDGRKGEEMEMLVVGVLSVLSDSADSLEYL